MSLTKEQKKALVMQWKNAAPELQEIKDKELSEFVYDWRIVDALLEIGANSRRSLKTSGLIEMQRLFMLLREKQGK